MGCAGQSRAEPNRLRGAGPLALPAAPLFLRTSYFPRSAKRRAGSALRRPLPVPPPAPHSPQGADEAVDGALGVEGHDVPDVQKAGHFLRHFASFSVHLALRHHPHLPRSQTTPGEAGGARRNGGERGPGRGSCGADRSAAPLPPAARPVPPPARLPPLAAARPGLSTWPPAGLGAERGLGPRCKAAPAQRGARRVAAGAWWHAYFCGSNFRNVNSCTHTFPTTLISGTLTSSTGQPLCFFNR